MNFTDLKQVVFDELLFLPLPIVSHCKLDVSDVTHFPNSNWVFRILHACVFRDNATL